MAENIVTAFGNREKLTCDFDFEDDLIRKMTITAGARFNAAARVSTRSKSKNFLVAFTTGYIILLTMSPFFIGERELFGFSLSYISIILSIIVLITSLLDQDGLVIAEQYHRSSLEINELRREMELVIRDGGLDKEELAQTNLRSLSENYNSILQKYSINHDSVDFKKYCTERPEKFDWFKWYHSLHYNGQFWFSKNLFYIINFLAFLMFLGSLILSSEVK